MECTGRQTSGSVVPSDGSWDPSVGICAYVLQIPSVAPVKGSGLRGSQTVSRPQKWGTSQFPGPGGRTPNQFPDPDSRSSSQLSDPSGGVFCALENLNLRKLEKSSDTHDGRFSYFWTYPAQESVTGTILFKATWRIQRLILKGKELSGSGSFIGGTVVRGAECRSSYGLSVARRS